MSLILFFLSPESIQQYPNTTVTNCIQQVMLLTTYETFAQYTQRSSKFRVTKVQKRQEIMRTTTNRQQIHCKQEVLLTIVRKKSN